MEWFEMTTKEDVLEYLHSLPFDKLVTMEHTVAAMEREVQEGSPTGRQFVYDSLWIAREYRERQATREKDDAQLS